MDMTLGAIIGFLSGYLAGVRDVWTIVSASVELLQDRLITHSHKAHLVPNEPVHVHPVLARAKNVMYNIFIDIQLLKQGALFI